MRAGAAMDAILPVMPSSAPPHHFDELDSLRGLAAMTVVFYHVSLYWSSPHPVWWTRLLQSPLGLLISGPDAVYLFFVMSGFVLFLPYLRAQEPQPYAGYLMKRICRIYLPYVAALILSVGADLLFFRPIQGLIPGVAYWSRPFPVEAIWPHLLFIGRAPIGEFNPAFWSLVHEMRISLVFPLIAFWPSRLSLWAGVLASLATCAGGFLLAGALHWRDLATLGYAGLFFFGAVIARHLVAIRSLVAPHPALTSTCLMVLAVVLFKILHVFPASFQQWWWIVTLHGSGAALVMVLALTTRSLQNALRHASLRWLGRVSYAIYLVHGTVLYALTSIFWTRTTHHVLLLVCGILLTILLAWPFHLFVEEPSIRLGRRLARRSTVTRSPQLSGS